MLTSCRVAAAADHDNDGDADADCDDDDDDDDHRDDDDKLDPNYALICKEEYVMTANYHQSNLQLCDLQRQQKTAAGE